ncbi:hypothetical protein [Nocardia sp. XZ_19_369]|uniref:hypothetical protein n=1 Tax=Nocardia sp. XZ_19_369 TaxID=2769487 RepID=UPI0018903066|nr:hypothetical protein [Nocardia sp. XZ_19_369]
MRAPPLACLRRYVLLGAQLHGDRDMTSPQLARLRCYDPLAAQLDIQGDIMAAQHVSAVVSRSPSGPATSGS